MSANAYKNITEEPVRVFAHITEEDIEITEAIKDVMKGMERDAQRLLLAHARGMKQMQEIMEKKTA